MIILYEKCDPELAKQKTLPRDSYLVKYMNDNEVLYDIVRSGTRVEIFDHYYDKSLLIQSIDWTEGNVHPKMYGYTPKDVKKKRR